MTDISKEAVDGLLQGVTGGKWNAYIDRPTQTYSVKRGEHEVVAWSGFDSRKGDENSKRAAADARFIAAARELVPALRAALDEAEARTVKAEAQGVHWQTEAIKYAEAASVAKAERDAANALLQRLTEWDECWPSKDVQNIAHEARAHLGAKP